MTPPLRRKERKREKKYYLGLYQRKKERKLEGEEKQVFILSGA